MTKAKRFLFGFIILLSLIILNSLMCIFNKQELKISFIIPSIIIFFITSFVIQLWEKLIGRRFIQIFKIMCSVFFLYILITEFSFFKQDILFIISFFIPFPISLIPLSPSTGQTLDEKYPQK